MYFCTNLVGTLKSAASVALAGQPREVDQRHIIVPAVAGVRPLNRAPAVGDVSLLAPVEAIAVDGLPTASRVVDVGVIQGFRRRRRPAGKVKPQRAFGFAAPATVGGVEVGDIVIASLAELHGDERSPVRGDAYRIAALAYAVTGPVLIPPNVGAAFVGGADTPANRERWYAAARVFDSLALRRPGSAQWVTVGRAEARPDGLISMRAPAWWTAMQGGFGAWRFSGGLWRPALAGKVSGGVVGFRSGLERTVAGLEARLCWSPSAGRGQGGRIPDALRPVRPGGPGPAVWIPWGDVITLAGEPVEGGTRGTTGKRYRRRVEALEAAGYLVPGDGGTTRAGDTVEIARVVDGRGRGSEAGLMVRASARFVEAVERGQKQASWTRVPLTRLLGPDG